MTVVDYVADEVDRQGHDLYVLDGIERTAWMLEAWCCAIGMSEGGAFDLLDIEQLGKRVEPLKNESGFRTCGVRVGSRICPAATEVKRMLVELLAVRDSCSPLEFYRKFEEIHPFVDGNGRTGKILLNWLNNSLLHPIRPPADFWGQAIRNP